MIRSEKYKGFTIELHQDPDPENPRTEWDNATEMICFHRRYNLGDRDHGFIQGNYNGWDELEEELRKDAAAILPVYMYDHSGLTINTRGFSCPWDSGQIGYIRITCETAKREWPDAPKEELEEYCRQDIRAYDQYLRGDVYGYIVKEGDEERDSCWGYYGEEYALENARSWVDGELSYRNALFEAAGVEVPS